MTSHHEEIMKKPCLPFKMGYLTEEMVEKAMDELEETDEAKAKCIPELRKLIQDDERLICPTDDAYLLQYLRPRKFKTDRAFTLLQNYYKCKKSYADLYNKFDEEVIKKVFRLNAIYLFPQRDDHGCVIYLIRLRHWNPDEAPIDEACIALTYALLLCPEDVATQVCGIRIMVDVAGATLKQIRSVTPRYITLFSKALRNHFPTRFKSIHFYNESTVFHYLWSMLKLFLTEKIKRRVHFHGDNQKQLQKFIPKAILPSEYGGNEQLNTEWFQNEVEKFLDKYHELTTYGYRN